MKDETTNVEEVVVLGNMFSTSSLETKSESSIEVYPNPADNECRIKLINPGITDCEVTLRLCDIQGKQIKSITKTAQPGFQEILLDTSTLKSGIYVVDCT